MRDHEHPDHELWAKCLRAADDDETMADMMYMACEIMCRNKRMFRKYARLIDKRVAERTKRRK